MKLFLSLLCAAVASAELTINSFSKIKAGEDKTISWSYDGSPAIDRMDIDLVSGDENNLQVVVPIASDISPGDESFKWSVPATLDNRGDYALRVTANTVSGRVYRFTARFSIEVGIKSSDTTPPPSVTKSSSNSPPVTFNPLNGAMERNAISLLSLFPIMYIFI